MKYIKTYEDRHIPKFKIGDLVKIKNDSNIIYVIDGYDYRDPKYFNAKRGGTKDICRLKKYEDKDKLVDREGMFSWIIEERLELVSDYELNSITYNL